jgi:hypothetical protein
MYTSASADSESEDTITILGPLAQPSLVVHDAAKYTQVAASSRGGLHVFTVQPNAKNAGERWPTNCFCGTHVNVTLLLCLLSTVHHVR